MSELMQLHHTDVSYLLKLRASQALFTALDTCRDGIIVTGLDHNIQVMFYFTSCHFTMCLCLSTRIIILKYINI